MTYPTQVDLSRMCAETGAPEGMDLARVALRLGLSWGELNEIRVYGRVMPDTANYWRMVREHANA